MNGWCVTLFMYANTYTYCIHMNARVFVFHPPLSTTYVHTYALINVGCLLTTACRLRYTRGPIREHLQYTMPHNTVGK